MGGRENALSNHAYEGAYLSELWRNIKSGRASEGVVDELVRQRIAEMRDNYSRKGHGDPFHGASINTLQEYKELSPRFSFDARREFIKAFGNKTQAKKYGVPLQDDVINDVNSFHDADAGDIVGIARFDPQLSNGVSADIAGVGTCQ